ncbi:aminoglycoside phosphotransferase family protein [Streptomyces montanisoli]|uniref:Aminoglycoside phosphotransferase family protein n=1 Tax=Streptomyces montanisoli TaxID=2798581 RepID=A0A940M4J3_9ACTN|nr:aminoglycoside phosphotransferase family protein [Streptomyces montanisoli]MBP0455985.1 aminoglycoside phosphotransferase family protein [Streptomyces montanisoli]
MTSEAAGGPVGRQEFTAGTAGASLREACAAAGVDASGAELLRLGSNAVYRLPSAPVIVRIARDVDAAEDMQRAVAVARWLASQDFPATRILPRIEQPLTAAGRVVTFWESAQEREEYATVAELADLLKRLHWLDEPETLHLSYFDPVGKLWSSLRAMRGVAPEDAAFLEQRVVRLAKEYERLDFVLPFGMIHGDANVGNVLRHRDGQAILIDLDGFTLAPREWDLILTAIYYDRFGWHTRTEYEGFVHHYGFDVMNWPGYSVLADVRELMMVLWMGQQVADSAKSAAEFGRRVETLRTDGSRKEWSPF